MDTKTTPTRRLASLDALRGFDLFFLVALGPIVTTFASAADLPWLNDSMWMFRHFTWEGFSPWDLIMPLFLFMSGASIPYALSKYKKGNNKKALAIHLARRVIILWILGMICQGNLLGLDPHKIYLYSNTLQAIATGYLVTALLFLFTSRRTQIITTASLLIAYWAAMQFISVDGYGAGNYTTAHNLAEWVDRTVLGRFRDGASVIDGKVHFAEWYHYTWILSSINFAATVMTGMFAGYIAKDPTNDKTKLKYYFFGGLAMIAIGKIWSIQMPIIKPIWTSSMVLFSSGCSFILMGLFYYWIDCKGHRKKVEWLRVYGMNSIAAYMLAETFNFRALGTPLFHGLEQYIGPYYSFLLTTWNAAVIYMILLYMHKKRIYLKV